MARESSRKNIRETKIEGALEFLGLSRNPEDSYLQRLLREKQEREAVNNYLQTHRADNRVNCSSEEQDFYEDIPEWAR